MPSLPSFIYQRTLVGALTAFCIKAIDIKIRRLALRVIVSVIAFWNEVHANVIPGIHGVSLTPVRPQLTHYTLKVHLSLQVWVIVQLCWAANVPSPRRCSRVLEAELMPGLDWREECTGADWHGWIQTAYVCQVALKAWRRPSITPR